MKRLLLAFAASLVFTNWIGAQVVPGQPDNNANQKRLLLVSELRDLAAEGSKLTQSLARAAAKAEIADAAWKLDQPWARTLLTEAYQLTLPGEDEGKNPGDRFVLGIRQTLNDQERARNALRSRILRIAGRDKSFAARLNEEGAKHLDSYDQNSLYASLARTAFDSGDIEEATKNIIKTFEIDPSQGSTTGVINDLAMRDRPTADTLIVQYIESIRTVPLATRDLVMGRIYLTLADLVFPNSLFPDPNKSIPPPGPAVMRAYVSYVIDSLRRLEQNAPGSLLRARGFLLTAWMPLKQYAPELTASFLELERLSRNPGQEASLPTQSMEERNRESYNKRTKAAQDSDQPDGATINSMIGRGDFDKARKLIDKLPDGEPKAQLLEKTNAQEAISLALKGDIFAAAKLAERLTKANWMLRVYPTIIQKCVANKDQACARSLAYQAVKQLRNADTTLPELPPGTPATVMVTGREFDPVVQSLGILAQSLLPVDSELSLDMLDEMVLALNKSALDMALGRLGFDPDLFVKLEAVNEGRVQEAARNLTPSLQRIAALAAIYRFKAAQLDRKVSQPLTSKKSEN